MESSSVNNHNTFDTFFRFALSSTYDRKPSHCYRNLHIGHMQMSFSVILKGHVNVTGI
jgi:hypothetical protein